MNGFKNRLKATKRAMAQPKPSRWRIFGTRVSRIRLKKMAVGAALLSSTFGVVVIALYAALTIETAIKDESWKTPQELGGAITDYIYPWESRHDLIKAFDDSIILDSLDSVSIITALALFILVGRREEERQAHYLAWFMLDAARDRETSYARYHALQDLNEDGISLKGLDAQKTDLIRIDLEGADLQEATLDGIKLRKANLRKANLTFASLRRANLRSATLESVVLFDANLQEANLSGANLNGADLGDANLNLANFFDANLRGANLANADLEGASFEKARNLTVAQVKQAKNWDKAKYDEEFQRQLSSNVQEPLPDAAFPLIVGHNQW